MNRRQFVDLLFKLVPVALFSQIPLLSAANGFSTSAKLFLVLIDFDIPDKMSSDELARYQHNVVDVVAFDLFDQKIMKEKLLLTRHLEIREGRGRWYYLFKDKQAYQAWDLGRPQYSAENKIQFSGNFHEMTDVEFRQSEFAFLLSV